MMSKLLLLLTRYPAICWAAGIPELPFPNKQLLLITDILGRTTQPVPNNY